MKPTTFLLEAKGLSVAFGGLLAVNQVELGIHEGSIHALIGPNGAGKSTVVNALSGFVRPTAGSLTLDGSSIFARPAHVIAAAGLARTFQNIRLFGAMTVLETVLVGAHRQYRNGPLDLILRRGRVRAAERQMIDTARQLLDFVGLGGDAMLERTGTTLSYGHQRRLEIARALISRPRLLLLDEPLAGMNIAEKEELCELIQRIRSTGVTVLLIEHDMGVIRQLADHITVLFHGERLADGHPQAVFADPAVQQAYLGKAKVKAKPKGEQACKRSSTFKI